MKRKFKVMVNNLPISTKGAITCYLISSTCFMYKNYHAHRILRPLRVCTYKWLNWKHTCKKWKRQSCYCCMQIHVSFTDFTTIDVYIQSMFQMISIFSCRRCIVFENFTVSIGEFMVANWDYRQRVSEASKRIFATIDTVKFSNTKQLSPF